MHTRTLRVWSGETTVCRILSCRRMRTSTSADLQLFTKIVWDDPPSRRRALRWQAKNACPPGSRQRDGGTPGSKFAGGHRIRVTPVPIPNTEVKPDTADGTAWETAWESRSLPALFEKPDRRIDGRALFFVTRRQVAAQFPTRCGLCRPSRRSRETAGLFFAFEHRRARIRRQRRLEHPSRTPRSLRGRRVQLQRYASASTPPKSTLPSIARTPAPRTRGGPPAVPTGFRFAVKMPKVVTHDRALTRARVPLSRFLDEVGGLGSKLGPLLVQLPPSCRSRRDGSGDSSSCCAASTTATWYASLGTPAGCRPRPPVC